MTAAQEKGTPRATQDVHLAAPSRQPREDIDAALVGTGFARGAVTVEVTVELGQVPVQQPTDVEVVDVPWLVAGPLQARARLTGPARRPSSAVCFP